MHDHDPVWVGNVRWLAGYRHPRHHHPGVAQALVEAFARPRGLLAGVRLAGDPLTVLPVCYHLLWKGVLVVDLAVPLGDETVVGLAGTIR